MFQLIRSRYLAALPAPGQARPWLVRCAFLGLACALAGLVLAVPLRGSHLAVIWLPAGVAIAGLLRFGLNLWPGVAAAAFALAWAGGASPPLAALLAAGSTAGPLLGAWWLKREGQRIELDRLRDLRLCGLFGVVLPSLIAASNGVLWEAIAGHVDGTDLPSVWARWLVGDALGAVALGVPLLAWSRSAWAQAFGTSRRWASIGLMLASFAALAVAAAVAPAGQWLQSPLFFLPHLMLAWLAWRTGLFASSCVALSLTIVAAAFAFTDLSATTSLGAASLLSGYVFSLLAVPLGVGAFQSEALRSERRWRLALDLSQTGLGDWDVASGRIILSAHWLHVLGHEVQSFGGSVDDLWALVHPEDRDAARASFRRLQTDNAVDARAECRMRRRDDAWRVFELQAMVIERAAGGAASRILITARDIGELQAARARQDLSQSVFQHLHEGLLITDPQNRVIEANPTFSRITGYSRDELVGQMAPMLVPRAGDDELIAQLEAMQTALAAGGNWRGELRHRQRDGRPGLLQLAISAVRGADGTVLNHVLAITDITHAREQLEQLERQAHFDELTRLPNRVRLAQMLQAAMQTSRREGSLLTVCYLDIDHFKPVNDQFGHEAGDRLLVELANRMRRSLRSWAGGDDVVARIGGDEFVLLLRTATIEESRHAVQRVLAQICLPYGLGVGAGPVMVTASIGATVFPLDSADPETLLRHADHAMYGAKQAGRNGYLFFDAEHDKRTEARFVALGRVQEALDAEEFLLYFQPKVDMRTSKVLGVEALLRWKHPDEGMISPKQFLPLIENTDLSISVGNWVMQRGIEHLAQWLRIGLDMTVSINVSARHLQEPRFAEHLSELLSRHQAPVARHLIIEVLETTALADIDYTCALMDDCRALGVRFALDDFGTGYSTFTYLKRLPIDMLKIDRSFVINMLGDHQDLAIVEGVIGLSQTFGCAVVAEGVETPAQAQRLIEIGCAIGQGNGIAAAMPADDVLGWVQNYKGMSTAPQMLPV